MGHLDLLFKVTELFIEYPCEQNISWEEFNTDAHHFFNIRVYNNKILVKFEVG